MLPIAALIGAILYRARGGVLKDWFGIGTQLSRLAWAIPTAALMTEMSNAPWWLVFPLILSNFMSLVMYGTGQYLQDFPLRFAPDLIGLSRTTMAAIPLMIFHPPLGPSPTWAIMFSVYALSGATHSLLYWLGHRTGHGSQAGECIVGGVSWVAITLCR